MMFLNTRRRLDKITIDSMKLENLHLLERIQLLRSIDLDMRNIFRRERHVEELEFIRFCHLADLSLLLLLPVRSCTQSLAG